MNVANVKVLPVPIPIVNERRKAMKKLMMAVGCGMALVELSPAAACERSR